MLQAVEKLYLSTGTLPPSLLYTQSLTISSPTKAFSGSSPYQFIDSGKEEEASIISSLQVRAGHAG